jgi:hypothetical protein
MGTFAETAIVYYHLLFTDQGKQISVSVNICIYIHIYRIYKYKYNIYCVYIIYIYLHISIFMLLFQTGDFPLSVYRLLTVQTEVCRLPFVDGPHTRKLSVCKNAPNGLAHPCSVDTFPLGRYNGRNIEQTPVVHQKGRTREKEQVPITDTCPVSTVHMPTSDTIQSMLL